MTNDDTFDGLFDTCPHCGDEANDLMDHPVLGLCCFTCACWEDFPPDSDLI